jgi:hypothetical protein
MPRCGRRVHARESRDPSGRDLKKRPTLRKLVNALIEAYLVTGNTFASSQTAAASFDLK